MFILFPNMLKSGGVWKNLFHSQHVRGNAVVVWTPLEEDPALGGCQSLLGVLEVIQEDGIRAIDPRVDHVDRDILAQAALQVKSSFQL